MLYDNTPVNKIVIQKYIEDVSYITNEQKKFINSHIESPNYRIIKDSPKELGDYLSEMKVLFDVITDTFVGTFFKDKINSDTFLIDVYSILNDNINDFFAKTNIDSTKINFVFKGGNIMKYYYEKVKNQNTNMLNLNNFFKTSDFDFGLYISDNQYSKIHTQFIKKIIEVPLFVSLFQISEKYDEYYNTNTNLYSNYKNSFLKNCLDNVYSKKDSLFININNEYLVIDNDINNLKISSSKRSCVTVEDDRDYHYITKNRMNHYITCNKTIHTNYTDFDLLRIKLHIQTIMKKINNNGQVNLLLDTIKKNTNIIKRNIEKIDNQLYEMTKERNELQQNQTYNGQFDEQIMTLQIRIDTYKQMLEPIERTFFDNVKRLEGELVTVNIPSEFVDVSVAINHMYDFTKKHYIIINNTRINCISESDIVSDIIVVLLKQNSYFPWKNAKYDKRINRLLFFMSRILSYSDYLALCAIIKVIVEDNYIYETYNSENNIFKYKINIFNITYDISFTLIENNNNPHLFEIIYVGLLLDKYDDIKLFICNILLLKLFNVDSRLLDIYLERTSDMHNRTYKYTFDNNMNKYFNYLLDNFPRYLILFGK